MRVTTAFKRLLDIDGITVADVAFQKSCSTAFVSVRLRRRRLQCPSCSFSTRARYDVRPVDSQWRHLDFGTWRVELRAQLRRLGCPVHGVKVESVPFARPNVKFTRDFEQFVAWSVVKMDKTAVSTLCRIDWKTVGRICERVSADVLDPRRLDKLSKIGVDEVAWRKGYRFLTLVTDHETHKVVWGRPGKNQFAFDEFFAELGEDRTRTIKAVTLDMAPAFRRAVLNNAPQADICIDPFHVVQLVNRALEAERRALWRELQHEDAALANKFRGARWALLKNPEDLTSKQALTLEMIRESGNKLWEGYLLKESIRSVFAGDLSLEDADELLTTWSEKAMASSVRTFFVAGRTIKANREGILAGLRHGLNNGLIEGINNRVRLIVRRAFGFHSAEAVLALVMLSCGPVDLKLPHQMAR